MNLKMVRDAAPGLDRAYRRVHEAGYRKMTDRMRLTFEQGHHLIVRFAEPHHMSVVGGVFVEELHVDGWYGSAIFEDGNARTGAMIGYRFTHPMFMTRMGNAAEGRPTEWMVKGPMPHPELPLNKETIDRLADEAAEIVRDLLRKRAFAETGELIPVTPLPVDNPLETAWDRETTETLEEDYEVDTSAPASEHISLDDDEDDTDE